MANVRISRRPVHSRAAKGEPCMSAEDAKRLLAPELLKKAGILVEAASAPQVKQVALITPTRREPANTPPGRATALNVWNADFHDPIGEGPDTSFRTAQQNDELYFRGRPLTWDIGDGYIFPPAPVPVRGIVEAIFWSDVPNLLINIRLSSEEGCYVAVSHNSYDAEIHQVQGVNQDISILSPAPPQTPQGENRLTPHMLRVIYEVPVPVIAKYYLEVAETLFEKKKIEPPKQGDMTFNSISAFSIL